MAKRSKCLRTIPCKPNRSSPRYYTAKDVGRIACRAIETGASRVEVQKELEDCVGDKCDAEKALLRRIIELAAEISLAIGIMQLLLTVASVLLPLIKVIPLLTKLALRLEKLKNARILEGEWEIIVEEAKILLQKLPPP